MKCEVRSSCRSEAELWIHLNGRPKRSCVACSTRAIGDLQVVESHWHAPLDQPCPPPAHRALTPAEREAIIKAEDRNGGKAIPLPPPTEETEARLPSSDSPSTAEPSEETDMGSKPLTLTLRPDADAHPELCRVAECPWGDRPPVGLVRGLCPADTATLRKHGLYHAFALPSVRRKRSPSDAEVTPDGEATTLSEGDALLPHGAAASPVVVPTVERSPAGPMDLSGLTVTEPTDPPPAPPPPAVVDLQVIRQSDGDSVEAARAHLRAALGLTPYANELPDGTPTAKAGIAALADVAGAWMKGREARLQNVLGKTEAMLEKVDAAHRRGCELETALQTYADLRAKLCEVFGEDPAELTDQGIVDKATMAQHWWGKTVDEFKAFRLAVAQLVDVEEDQADADYLLDNLRAALEQPPPYGPFRVDSAVYIPNGRGQATLTWAHGDKVLVPAGSMVNLIVVGVGRG